jgi:tetratricopeptide (TPR) repeat protein
VRLLAPIVVALALALPAAPARAGGTVWDRVLRGDPAGDDAPKGKPPAHLSKYEKHLWIGDYYASRAAQMTVTVRPRGRTKKLVDTAIAAYRNAAKARPDSPEPHYRLAWMIYEYHLSRSDDWNSSYARFWRPQAIEEWETFEKLAPKDPRVVYILPTRSLEYTKAGDNEKALADYVRLLELYDLQAIGGKEAGRLASNRAEIHMMLGQMEAAIEWYQQALSYQPEPNWAFGLAVAYDREGHAMRAREILAAYVTKSTAQQFIHELKVTKELFFVPKGEVHYYLALIQESLGNYDLAIASFRDYIASGAHPQFQARARHNIRALQKKLKTMGKKPNDWRRTWHLGEQNPYAP